MQIMCHVCLTVCFQSWKKILWVRSTKNQQRVLPDIADLQWSTVNGIIVDTCVNVRENCWLRWNQNPKFMLHINGWMLLISIINPVKKGNR